jgi:hypothetical protein
MRLIILLAAPLLLAGCAGIDQSRLGNFVNRTVQPGMPMQQALVRMQAEGFYCNAANPGDAITSCTRTYERLVRKDCVEQVDLIRSSGAASALGAIDVLAVKCPK